MLIHRKLVQCLSSFRYCCSLAFSIKKVLSAKPINETLIIQGWVQAVRRYKDIYFVDLTDGSCAQKLQIIVDNNSESFPAYGSSIEVEGTVIKSSHKAQELELLAKSWKTVGECPENYPFLYRQKYSSEYVRQFAHMRPRTRSFGATLRIRSCASYAIHKYFQDEGFHFIHTPIITLNDCEGAGEVFTIKVNKSHSSSSKCDTNMSLNLAGKAVNSQTEATWDTKVNDKLFEKAVTESSSLKKDSERNSTEFFKNLAYLTVSGQMHLEAMACSLSRVYNFGPVFRAENSHSKQHASEFHMIEAEIAFVQTIEQLMSIIQDLMQKTAAYILSKCDDDINVICEKYTKNHKDYLLKLISNPFVQIPYSEAITILNNNKDSTVSPIQWGDDLGADHKQFLVKYCDEIPVFVCMFPASLKPFYMKRDENKMAFCFDLFGPFGGELCGGSLREDNEEKLKMNLPLLETNSNLSWYLDLRRYGSVPHGGFGIGFDRLLQTILGISNIRDIIPFPRRKHDCQC